jgi:hypothetical protein
MKKHCLISTYYAFQSDKPSRVEVKGRFNYDGDVDDIFINFSNNFDPWHTDHLDVGGHGRSDLIYGKIILLLDFIENNILGKYEYLCHVDYADVKFHRSYVEMMDKFINSGEDFIISTEFKAWPTIDVINTWVNYTVEEGNEFTFVNSGSIISKTQIMYEYLVKLKDLLFNTSIDFGDDQGVWQYYNLEVEPLNKDTDCTYTFSTALLDDTYWRADGNKIITKFDTHPYIIHDNSSFSLNLGGRSEFYE